MQFYWKPNLRPGATPQDGDSVMLALFLDTEIGPSEVWRTDVLAELKDSKSDGWIGNVMEFTHEGDLVHISNQYDEESPPDPVLIATFVAALDAWGEFVGKGYTHEPLTVDLKEE